MRDYSHDTNWKDKPKWKRFLINLKWKYVRADRHLHGRLTLFLIIGILLGVMFIANNPPQSDDAQAKEIRRLSQCLFSKGCVWQL